MICSLCLQEKDLIKKSHIIPDFMYHGIFDQNHFIHYVNIKNLEKRKRLPDGFYDRYILCRECDGVVISKLESYASRAFYMPNENINGLTVEEIGSENELRSLLIRNLDYTKFKLFLLSILWRAHISNHEFFKCIDLGKYAERIRKMIYENDPGEEHQFETCLIWNISQDVLYKSIVEPRYLKSNGNSSYVFYINEVFYHFNLSKHNKISLFEKGRIEKDGTMVIGIPHHGLINGYFDSFIGQKLRLG